MYADYQDKTGVKECMRQGRVTAQQVRESCRGPASGAQLVEDFSTG